MPQGPKYCPPTGAGRGLLGVVVDYLWTALNYDGEGGQLAWRGKGRASATGSKARRDRSSLRNASPLPRPQPPCPGPALWLPPSPARFRSRPNRCWRVAMAAVGGLRVSVKAAEPEPMEVEEGELLLQAGAGVEAEAAAAGAGGEAPGLVPVRRSLRELLPPPDTGRRYENKAGSFITGIDVTSKEAIEKKEQRAKRFHFRAEVNLAQRNVALDRDLMKKAIPKLRLDTIYVYGVDEMSTQDIFAYFKEYPPAHIEWLDDTSCNVVWLDEVTATRALINMSAMPEDKLKSQEGSKKEAEANKKEKQEESSDDETEEGEVEDDHPSDTELDTLSQVEEDSLLRNDLRPASKLAKGNRLFMRFATRDDKKELGAARRSQYYMKYGNPNYGGMKGILSSSWKRRYHSRRLQRDVVKKRTLIGDDVGLTPPYKHRHSGLVHVPEEPIEEEEEEEEEDDDDDDDDQDMDEDDRVVVEYRDELQAFKQSRERSASRRSSASESDSDEMDYDLELKMISTPSPKKSMKMTMYADEVESRLKSIRNSMRADSVTSSHIKTRIGNKGPFEKISDVRFLLDEKRQASPAQPQLQSSGKSDVRQRLGKRPHSPEAPQPSSTSASHREPPMSDVHSRLGIPKQEGKGLYSDTREKKSANLWTRLGSASKASEKALERAEKPAATAEEEDSELQRAWGALIKEKEQSRQKKSRLDNLPSLQIEISRESSSESDTES